MNILNIVAGPLVGAVIGYFTNYIAVKMLFRPLHPVKFAGHTLPFTPGIIPRRRDAMAKAVGKAVGENLLTQKDLEAVFLSENVQDTVTKEICDFLYPKDKQEDFTIKGMLEPRMGSEKYAVAREHLQESFCEKISEELHNLELGTMIAQEGARIIREKTSGGFLEMMISDELIASIAQPVGEYIENYINDNAHDMVLPMIERQTAELEEKPLTELMEQANLEEERMKELAGKAYRTIVEKKAGGLLEKIRIADIVEQKICAMDVAEIEVLVLSVMEHELKTIVNLGALIGFIIGIVNIFI